MKLNFAKKEKILLGILAQQGYFCATQKQNSPYDEKRYVLLFILYRPTAF